MAAPCILLKIYTFPYFMWPLSNSIGAFMYTHRSGVGNTNNSFIFATQSESVLAFDLLLVNSFGSLMCLYLSLIGQL